jgi:hypothetical protein
MDKNTHPKDIEEVQALMEMFLEDVIFEYRENEIKDWLQGLNQSQIDAILQRENHEVLKDNSFVIPFVYLHYHVVPTPNLVGYLEGLMTFNTLIEGENLVLQNTIKYFKRIFSGKTEYIYFANTDESKSYQ